MAPFGLSCEASFWCPMAGSLDTNRSRLPTVACWIWRQASMKVGGVRWWLGKGYCEQKDGDSKHWKINLMGIWLVVWNMTFIFLYIGNVIIPIDFHIFQVYYYSWILQKHKPNIPWGMVVHGPTSPMMVNKGNHPRNWFPFRNAIHWDLSCHKLGNLDMANAVFDLMLDVD
jgi:hypothetical protein